MMWADPYAYLPTCNTEGNIEGKNNTYPGMHSVFTRPKSGMHGTTSIIKKVMIRQDVCHK